MNSHVCTPAAAQPTKNPSIGRVSLKVDCKNAAPRSRDCHLTVLAFASVSDCCSHHRGLKKSSHFMYYGKYHESETAQLSYFTVCNQRCANHGWNIVNPGVIRRLQYIHLA